MGKTPCWNQVEFRELDKLYLKDNYTKPDNVRLPTSAEVEEFNRQVR